MEVCHVLLLFLPPFSLTKNMLKKTNKAMTTTAQKGQLSYTQVGQWTTGLADCCIDKSICLEAVCCFHCQTAAQCNKLKNNAEGCACTYCLISMLCPVCTNCQLRGEIRNRYGIDGGSGGDCCTACLCGPCSLCQTFREMSIRGHFPGGCACVKEPFTFGGPPPSAQMGMNQQQPSHDVPNAYGNKTQDV